MRVPAFNASLAWFPRGQRRQQAEQHCRDTDDGSATPRGASIVVSVESRHRHGQAQATAALRKRKRPAAPAAVPAALSSRLSTSICRMQARARRTECGATAISRARAVARAGASSPHSGTLSTAPVRQLRAARRAPAGNSPAFVEKRAAARSSRGSSTDSERPGWRSAGDSSRDACSGVTPGFRRAIACMKCAPRLCCVRSQLIAATNRHRRES